MVLASCEAPWQEPELGLAVVVTNETDRELRFEVFGDGDWLRLPGTLPPGRSQPVLSRNMLMEPSRFTESGCTDGDLVAFDVQGDEVARHPPPLCDGDEWVIEND